MQGCLAVISDAAKGCKPMQVDPRDAIELQICYSSVRFRPAPLWGNDLRVWRKSARWEGAPGAPPPGPFTASGRCALSGAPRSSLRRKPFAELAESRARRGIVGLRVRTRHALAFEVCAGAEP